MATFLTILGFLLALVGIAGSILPVLPGPPLGFFALIILSVAKDWEPFSVTFLVIMAALTTGVTVLDFVAPAVGVKKYGGSKFAIWASIIGLIVGVFLFPPWGMIIGAFLGALAGEAVFGEKGKPVIRVVWGVFVGTLAGTGLKLAVSGVILFFYIKEMF